MAKKSQDSQEQNETQEIKTTSIEEYNIIISKLSDLPFVTILGKIPDYYQLHDQFLGKAYSFAGYIKVPALYPIGNGTFRAVEMQRIFFAHLIDPPELPKNEIVPYRNVASEFQLWKKDRFLIPEYKDYKYVYENEGIYEILAYEVSDIRNKIIDLYKTLTFVRSDGTSLMLGGVNR